MVCRYVCSLGFSGGGEGWGGGALNTIRIEPGGRNFSRGLDRSF